MSSKDGKTYNPWIAYAQSKTANILFSVALTEKLKERGVVSFSVCPGCMFCQANCML